MALLKRDSLVHLLSWRHNIWYNDTQTNRLYHSIYIKGTWRGVIPGILVSVTFLIVMLGVILMSVIMVSVMVSVIMVSVIMVGVI